MRLIYILILFFSLTGLKAQEKKYIKILKVDITERFEDKKADYYKLKGNIQLEHDGMILFCDSAYLFEAQNKFEAFGSVRLNKGDSVQLNSDSLFYNGNTQLSYAKGEVSLRHHTMLLLSNSVYYDMNHSSAYYTNHGTIYNSEDTLSSRSATYYMDQSKINFQEQVAVRNSQYKVDSENMTYLTDDLILTFSGYTHLNNDSLDLYFNEGFYNRKSEIAHCKGEVRGLKSPHSLLADSIFVDENKNRIEAYHNVVITDSLQKLQITGNKAIINKKDFTGEFTDSPIAKQYQATDTFYLKAETLYTFKEKENWNMHAYNNVQFFKKDIQGSAAILKYNQELGYIELFQEPLLWSQNSQISADSIKITLVENAIDSLLLDHNVFIIQEVDTSENYFSQIKGRKLRGKFNGSALEKIHIQGNAESKYYVVNKLNQVEGLNFIQSSGINMRMKDGKIHKVDFLQQPTGTYIPIHDLSSEQKLLKKFKWIPESRPNIKDFIQ